MSKCTGCRGCLTACKFENNTTLDFTLNYRWLFLREKGAYPEPKVKFYTIACNHCAEPFCLPACPHGAISKRPQDGIVLIDQDKCTGCGDCIPACPYHVPQINRVTHKAEKCTFCVHRVEQGLRPACVDTCVGGAIQFGVGGTSSRHFPLREPPAEFADPR